jgi:hypothetical protein
MLSSGSINSTSLAGIALIAHSAFVWIIDSGATNHMCHSLFDGSPIKWVSEETISKHV